MVKHESKAIFLAHSPVFEAMFRCDMEECRTGKIFMKDISSRGVQVLLMYLYCWELGDAAFDMDLALELLRTAHKYDMKDLDSDLTQMLLQRPIEMYSVNFALDLFLFARNIVLEYNLKLKAMKILKLWEIEPIIIYFYSSGRLFVKKLLIRYLFQQVH